MCAQQHSSDMECRLGKHCNGLDQDRRAKGRLDSQFMADLGKQLFLWQGAAACVLYMYKRCRLAGEKEILNGNLWGSRFICRFSSAAIRYKQLAASEGSLRSERPLHLF